MSSAAFLHAPAEAAERRGGKRKQHVLQAMAIDAQVDLGEEVVACLVAWFGEAFTTALLETLDGGAQSSGVGLAAGEVIDLTGPERPTAMPIIVPPVLEEIRVIT